jgi:hypothetical protein
VSEPVLVLALVVVACGVLFYLATAARRRRPATIVGLRRELDRLTHDPRSSTSLLERERARSPELTELELLQVVLRRLRRERRR